MKSNNHLELVVNNSVEQVKLDKTTHEKTESIKKELKNLASNKTIFEYTKKRAQEYLEEIEKSIACLNDKRIRLIFIGSVGVGKSTAIAHFVDLLNHHQERKSNKSILPSASGRTTICEFEFIFSKNKIGFNLESLSKDEILVNLHLLSKKFQSKDKSKIKDTDQSLLSQEMENVIKNMLQESKEDLESIADKCTENGELSEEKFIRNVMNLLKLDNRTKTEEYYDELINTDWKSWLQKELAKVNSGRNSNFGIPKKIKVELNINPFLFSDYEISIFDTKGLDGYFVRNDLFELIQNPTSITYVASAFSNAPEESSMSFLKTLKENGLLESASINMLILPKNEEQFDVIDQKTGEKVNDRYSANEIKLSEIQSKLKSQDISVGRFYFYNSHLDESFVFLDKVKNDIDAHIKNLRRNLDEILNKAHEFVLNYENQELKHTESRLSSQIRTFLDASKLIYEDELHSYLINQIKTERYASRVRASILRKGNWDNFNFVWNISHAGQQIANKYCGKEKLKFEVILNNLENDPLYKSGKNLIDQVRKKFVTEFNLLKDQKIPVYLQSKYPSLFKNENQLWIDCDYFWGSGLGFNLNVGNISLEWFRQNESSKENEMQFKSFLNEEWEKVIFKVKSLLK